MSGDTSILCEVPPCTPDLCAQMWSGQGDPLYAIGSSWSRRRELASDMDLPWSTGEGEGFYLRLSVDEIRALRRAALEYRELTDRETETGDPPDEETERIYDDAAFFLGLPRDDGRGWPAQIDFYDHGVSGPFLLAPAHGWMLVGAAARAKLEGMTQD